MAAPQPTKSHLPEWAREGLKCAYFRVLVQAIIKQPIQVQDDEDDKALDDNVSRVIDYT